MPLAARNSLRRLVVAGLIDSFGLALGWTVFTLLAISTGGLAAAGMYNAAMLTGVMLSAPVTGWLARRVPGRTLLQVTGSVEIVLRVATLFALLAGWAPVVIVVLVIMMNVAAWAGFAGMRAEVAAITPGPRAMTRYAMSIAAIEAVGAGVAAALPIGSPGGTSRALLVAVIAVYGASLLPTFGCARRSQVPSTRSVCQPDPVRSTLLRSNGARGTAGIPARQPFQEAHSANSLRILIAPLLGGTLIMLVASGPTRLAVALGAELYGRFGVVAAMAAFSCGSLLSFVVVDRVAHSRLPVNLIWTMWGIGMVIGWTVAPWNIAGLLGAQLLAGLSLTAFEGAMDAHVADDAGPGRATAVLAWSAASRALGSAAAVKMLPLLVTAPEVGQLSISAAGIVAVGGGVVYLAVKTSVIRAPSPPTHVPHRSPHRQPPAGQELAQLSAMTATETGPADPRSAAPPTWSTSAR